MNARDNPDLDLTQGEVVALIDAVQVLALRRLADRAGSDAMRQAIEGMALPELGSLGIDVARVGLLVSPDASGYAPAPTDAVRPRWWPPYVTRHARERFELANGPADEQDVLWDLAGGVALDHAMTATLTGRPYIRELKNWYVLGRARTGIHVIAPAPDALPAWAIKARYEYGLVTFLRLADAQGEFVRRYWP